MQLLATKTRHAERQYNEMERGAGNVYEYVYVNIYIYIYIYVCVCACVCELENSARNGIDFGESSADIS
jgi:hypothetical protein